MRHVGPTLNAAQRRAAELIVEFAHFVSRALHLDEDRWSGRQKCFHVSQFDIEGDDAAASLLQKLERCLFRSAQFPWGKNREMGRHMSDGGMKFPAQLFDKLADRTPNVRY